ncbi:MAG TPA: diguanylate cyclase [Myxococcales bacterium]|nr:diguanylate cyclase [Myxococcales bacterium]
MHNRLRRHLEDVFAGQPESSPHLQKLLRKIDEEYRRADGDRASLQHALGLLSELLKRPPEVERRRRISPKMRAIVRLFDQAPFAAILCDPDRKVTAWNGAAERLLGVPANEAVGRELSMLIFADTDADRAQARAEIRELIDSGETQQLVRATPVRGAPERTCEWTIVPLRDRDGGQVGHAAVVQEIDPLRDRYAIAWEGSGDGIWDWNLATGKLWVSDSWRAIVGAPAGAEDPAEWLERIHPADRDVVDAKIRAHLEGQASRFESEHRLRHADGSWRWVLSRGQATRDATGKAVRFSGSMMDVTEPRAPASLVLSDPLTHLPNRGQFLELVKRSLGHARRSDGYRLAVVIVDVDRFKSINERLGHAGGDEVLVELAGRLQTCLREGDALARPAGDEFAVLLDEVSEAAETQAVAKRIHEAAARPIASGGQSVAITVSIGIALSTPAHASADDLLLDAAAALHRAKAQGARTAVFEPAMRASQIVGLDSARSVPPAPATPPANAEQWTAPRRASRSSKR